MHTPHIYPGCHALRAAANFLCLLLQIMAVYAQYGVVPLFESPVKSEAELQQLQGFLAVYEASQSGKTQQLQVAAAGKA